MSENNITNKIIDKELNSSSPHIVLIVIIFIFQFLAKLFEKKVEDEIKISEEDKKKGNRFLYRYIFVFSLAKAADWCLGPFVYEFFSKYHGLVVSDIGKLVGLSFLSNLILGPTLIGYLNDNVNKKIPCLLFGLVLSCSCLVRMIQNPIGLILSQICFGCGSSILYSSFESWLNAESKILFPEENTRKYILSQILSINMILDSISAVTISLITGKLNNWYGIQTPYFFSALLCSLSIISVIIFVPSIYPNKIESRLNENDKIENKGKTNIINNLIEAIKYCSQNPFLFLIGLTESLLFSCLHIFIFIWTPHLKSIKPNFDTGYVFTLLMISMIAGGTIFKASILFIGSAMKMVKFVSFFALTGFLMTNFTYDFETNLYGFLVFEISVSLFYPTYSMIKATYIPDKFRGTIMNLFKVPLHIIVIVTLTTMDNIFTIKHLNFICLSFSAFVFLMHLLFFNRENKINTINTNKSNLDTNNDNTFDKNK